MKKTTFWPARLFRVGLLFSALCVFSPRLYAQCQCRTDNGTIIQDVNPGDYYHYTIPLAYDANGLITKYKYVFQFPCMFLPLDIYPEDAYQYLILFREKGTTEWTIDEEGGMLYPHAGYFISAGPLDPCKTYEFRVTCPNCTPLPAQTLCEAIVQLQNYLNDPNNTLYNVSRIWEFCYAPIENQPINNFEVSSVDMANNSMELKWDHLPGPATYKIEYKKKNSFIWTIAGTTEGFEFQLNNLEACAEYNVRIRGSYDNCCGETKFSQHAVLNFVMTDCMANIENIDLVTGNRAHLNWTNIGVNLVDYQVTWWPTATPNNKMTATTSENEYFITGLEINTKYSVQVTGNCGPNTCPGYSRVHTFETNSCELNEPNNKFQNATPISFDKNHSNINIYPAGDIDFFKFTPTCDLIEIKIDHYDLVGYPNPDPDWWEAYDLPYTLYDQNFNEIPQTVGYYDFKDRWHNSTHWVNPGQEHYLAIRGLSATWQNPNCYIINAYPCLDCDVLTDNVIQGDDHVYSAPSIGNYGLYWISHHVEWSVTGPAVFINEEHLSSRQLFFTGTGTVTLTATVSTCTGESAIFHKEIIVSDECNIAGIYNAGPFNYPIREIGVNYLEDLDYTISLDIPDGVSFNFQLFAGSGNATWVIQGNQIHVHQISALAKFNIRIDSDHCNFESNAFTFVFEGDVPPYPPDPVDWLLSPNPTSNTLLVTPAIAPNTDLQSVPTTIDIRLYDQSTYLVLYQQGSTRTANSLNMSNLVPGNYTLQLGYGGYLKQFTVVKQ